ncbi:MAG: cytochrome c oxidase assembly protein, partial [Stellaceae bacterium]
MRASGKKRLTLGVLLLVMGCMIALVAASVPLYRLFCAATGYNGTTQRAETAPATEVENR